MDKFYNSYLCILLYFECYQCCDIEINIHFMTSFFLYAYTQFQCSMELGKKRKRSTNWTHTKKVLLQHTVSQLAIEQLCEQQENHVDTDTSSYPLSQGSHPQFLHIKRNVIPHKCTSRSCPNVQQNEQSVMSSISQNYIKICSSCHFKRARVNTMLLCQIF